MNLEKLNLQKLNPWNWFKHETDEASRQQQIPVMRSQAGAMQPASGVDSFVRIHREMERLFDDVFSAFGFPVNSVFSGEQSVSPELYRPQTDVSGDEKQYEVTIDVPGLNESDITVEVKGDTLLIKGHKEETNEQKDKHYYRVERRSGSFQRILSLPDDANPDEIKAGLQDGVLKLEIPRRALPQQDIRRIEISSS